MLTDANDWPTDPAFAAVFPLLSPQRMLGVLRGGLATAKTIRKLPRDWEACRAIEALYDPGRHVRVAYVLSADNGVASRRSWPEGDVVYVRYPVRSPMSRRGVVLDIDGRAMEVYRFPNDRRLRGLRKFTSRAAAATTWQQWLREDDPAIELDPDTLRRGLMRYVPEQKWIAHLRVQGYDTVNEQPVKRAIAVRSADVADCQDIYRRTIAIRRALSRAERSFHVPKPVALDSNLGLLATTWAWGKTLLEALQTPSWADVLTGVALGLDSFHRMEVEDLPDVTADDHLASAQRCIDDITIVLPSFASVLRSLMIILSRHRPSPTDGVRGTIHRDFHWNQLRVKRSRITVLDLDRCSVGDRSFDVATLRTQLSMLAIRSDMDVSTDQAARWNRQFLLAWEGATGLQIDAERVNWYSAIALLTLARGMVRHLRSGWPGLVEKCVTCAVRAMRHRGNLEVVA